MRAFTDTLVTKEQFVKEIVWHWEQDAFVQGVYETMDLDEVFRGCAIGCSIHSIATLTQQPLDCSDHSLYEKYLGVPEWLAKVEDAIFEGLPKNEAEEWPLQFTEAIKVGADLDQIKPAFLVFILEFSLEQLQNEEFKLQREAVESCIKLWQHDDIGSKDWELARSSTWNTALDAAAMHNPAVSAAIAATSAANSISQHSSSVSAAIADAIESVTWFAESSPSSSSSWAATSATYYTEFGDKLLELMRGQ